MTSQADISLKSLKRDNVFFVWQTVANADSSVATTTTCEERGGHKGNASLAATAMEMAMVAAE